MFVVFYTVILYNFVFITFSTSYRIYDTLMDPGNIYLCVCV